MHNRAGDRHVGIRIRYEAVRPNLDEKGLRLFAASEALAAKRGGIAAVSAVTGIARSTIGRGLKELAAQEKAPPHDRIRRTGGGRKAAVVKQPGLVTALTELIQSALRGDPEADSFMGEQEPAAFGKGPLPAGILRHL